MTPRESLTMKSGVDPACKWALQRIEQLEHALERIKTMPFADERNAFIDNTLEQDGSGNALPSIHNEETE